MKFIGEIYSYNIVDCEYATRGYQGNEVHKIFTNFLWRLSFINQLNIITDCVTQGSQTKPCTS